MGLPPTDCMRTLDEESIFPIFWTSEEHIFKSFPRGPEKWR